MGATKQHMLERQEYEAYLDTIRDDPMNEKIVEITDAVIKASGRPKSAAFGDIPCGEAIDLLMKHLTPKQRDVLAELTEDRYEDEAFAHACSKDD